MDNNDLNVYDPKQHYEKPDFNRNAVNPVISNERYTDRDAAFAIACLILSIIGFFTGFLIIGYGLDIAAIVFAIICLSGHHSGKGYAIAGLAVSVFSIVLGISLLLFAGSFISHAIRSIPDIPFFDDGNSYFDGNMMPYDTIPDEEPNTIENF